MAKREIKCPKCKHEWKTKSKLILVTCPSCQLKVKIKNEEETNESTRKSLANKKG